MKKIVPLLIFFHLSLFGDHFDLTIQTHSDRSFEEYLFVDTNTTQKLSKDIGYSELELSGNFNNIVGFHYTKNSIPSPDSIESKEIYIGTAKTKFLGYQLNDSDITYGARKYTQDSVKYTFYDLLTYEKTDIKTSGVESFIRQKDGNASEDMAYRALRVEKVILSSENLYHHVKENALEKDDYFYGVAISQNFTPWLRVYGIAIASYEQHDYSKGEANYYADVNGSQALVGVYDFDANTKNTLPTDGRFKGFGYGYKLTAEAYWKNLSLFVTSYYKKTSLKNYHTRIRDPETDVKGVLQYEPNITQKDTLDYLQKFTSFGLRYRF